MSLNVLTATGSYSGTGGAQSITVGWQPALVMVASTRTAGPSAGRAYSVKTGSMPGDDRFGFDTAGSFDQSDGITLTATGFDLGTDDHYNHNGTVFHWCAIRDYGNPLVSSYTGNGVDPQTVPGLDGGVPFAVVSGLMATFFKFRDLAGNDAMALGAAIGIDIAAITALSSGALNVEGNANVNVVPHYVLRFGERSGTVTVHVGQYTGSGGTQSVSLGRQPRAVLIYDSTGEVFGYKDDSMSGSDCGEMAAAYAWTASGGITITSTGFDVTGTYDTSANDLKYAAFF